MNPYISVGIGVVIINNNNEILLVLRKKAPEADKWSIPGGKVELFETLEDTAIREIKEEVNLSIEINQLLCTAETIDIDNNEHYISIIYTAKNVEGFVKNMEPDKLAEVRWFHLTNLPKNIASFSLPAIEKIKS